MKYIIKWENRNTGFKSQGSPISKESALAWVDKMNKEYPFIYHRAEPVKLTLV